MAHFNYKLLMINDKLKTEAVSYGQLFNRLRRCFVVLSLSPQVIEHLAQRAQIPFIIYHLSFFIYNSLFSGSRLFNTHFSISTGWPGSNHWISFSCRNQLNWRLAKFRERCLIRSTASCQPISLSRYNRTSLYPSDLKGGHPGGYISFSRFTSHAGWKHYNG